MKTKAAERTLLSELNYSIITLVWSIQFRDPDSYCDARWQRHETSVDENRARQLACQQKSTLIYFGITASLVVFSCSEQGASHALYQMWSKVYSVSHCMHSLTVVTVCLPCRKPQQVFSLNCPRWVGVEQTCHLSNPIPAQLNTLKVGEHLFLSAYWKQLTFAKAILLFFPGPFA